MTQILPNGRVEYEQRTRKMGWRKRAQYLDVFAAMAQREVPCEWTPELDET